MAAAGGVVFIAGNGLGEADGMLYAYDAAGTTNCGGTPRTCEPLWVAPVGVDALSPPTVAGGVVFVTGVVTASVPDHNRIAAFDSAGERNCAGTRKTCRPLWTANLTPPSALAGEGPLLRSPAVANGLVFVSGDDNNVHVYDAAGENGCRGKPRKCSELWTSNTDLFCDATFSSCGISAPAVENGVLYVTGLSSDGSTDGLYAFDASGSTSCSGTPKACSPLWTASVGSSVYPPAIAHDIVYTVGHIPFTQESNRLRAFDATGTTGCSGTPRVCEPLWTSSEEVSSASTLVGMGAPAVANGVVYAVSNDFECDVVCMVTKRLLAFDAAGSANCTGVPKQCQHLFAYEQTGDAFDEPVVANGVLYLKSSFVQAFTVPDS